MHYLAICAIFRDEAPFLAEWICFHRLVGVAHFYLYDNDSGDRPREALQPFIDRGWVTLIDWPIPFHRKAQQQAYQHCLDKVQADDLARWIAFIDLDEFLFSPTQQQLTDELKAYEGYPGVVANWQCYGSSGQREASDAPVIERFTWRARRNWVRNRKVKSIVDPARTVRAMGVHVCAHANDALPVDETGAAIAVGGKRPYRRRLRRWYRLLGPLLRFVDPYSNRDIGSRHVRVERLRINHYPIKSHEEFLRKARHKKEKRRYEDVDYFTYHDRNEVLDPVLQRYLPALKRDLAKLESENGEAGPASVAETLATPGSLS